MRPNRAILLAMASAEKPLNKYELEHNYTTLSKQTIYDWIFRMKILGWIVEKTETRHGRPIKYYALTDLGLFRAAKYASDQNPADLLLFERILRRLGNKYEKIEKKGILGHRRRIEDLTKFINEVLISGKALPGWSLQLQITANQDGEVKSWVHWGLPIGRRSRKRHLPFN